MLDDTAHIRCIICMTDFEQENSTVYVYNWKTHSWDAWELKGQDHIVMGEQEAMKRSDNLQLSFPAFADLIYCDHF